MKSELWKKATNYPYEFPQSKFSHLCMKMTHVMLH